MFRNLNKNKKFKQKTFKNKEIFKIFRTKEQYVHYRAKPDIQRLKQYLEES